MQRGEALRRPHGRARHRRDRPRGRRRFLVDDTRFWVVRPRIAGGQVSGLGTLLAGSYIGARPGQVEANERSDLRRASRRRRRSPPTCRARPSCCAPTTSARSTSARRCTSAACSPAASSPPRSRPTARSVTHRRLRATRPTTSSSPPRRASGTRAASTCSLDAERRASVQTQSLVTLLLGGIAFEHAAGRRGGRAAAAERRVPLCSATGRGVAPARDRRSRPSRSSSTQSVRGLAVGAPVDFRGINVGEVRAIDLEFDPKQVRFCTVVEVRPLSGAAALAQRIARAPRPRPPPVQRIQRFVERGFRAQLRSANLLTGQLYVALDFFPKAPKAKMDLAQQAARDPDGPRRAGRAAGVGRQHRARRSRRCRSTRSREDLRKALADARRDAEAAPTR